MTPKRLSLNISINSGPRPLHLVDRNVQDASASSTPSFSTKNTDGSRSHPVRRQSSISYHPRDADSVFSPSGPRHALTRSVEYRSPQRTVFKAGDRKSTESILGAAEKERQPHTLAEKHSELLQFIAQKESKCLELRSQLAIHEAELLQLKRKWECIVNRGFDKTNSQNDAVSHGQGSGPMLEGIKEGVQGVSRFIAAGLGEFSSPTSPPLSRHPTRGHVLHQSNSSISTYATKSTRFSQSSMSSLGDDPHSAQNSPSKKEETQDQVQILMVHDTGATPTMSPNFTFAHQQQLEDEKKKTRQDNAHNTGPEIGADDTNERAGNLHRRKSCEVTRSASVSPAHTPLSNSEISPNSPPIDSTSVKHKKRVNRASAYGNMSSGIPPASSIPGLGSLTVGVAAPSWVGSVGRKWEELQKGSTFSTSQKRASVLLSDVSQTIVSALSPPLACSFNPMPTPSLSSTISSASLLDADDHPSELEGMLSVMKPDPPVVLSTSPASSSPQDFNDEWNW